MTPKLIVPGCVCVAMVLSLVGCMTIGPQEMRYLGDETPTQNVVGTVDHFDWMGIGFDGEDIAAEYNTAVENAFLSAPDGTTQLRAVKAFRERGLWPYFASAALLAASGNALGFGIPGSSPALISLGVASFIGAVAVSGINQYTLYVVAEPVYE